MQIFSMLWVVIVMWLLIEFVSGKRDRGDEKLHFYDGEKD